MVTESEIKNLVAQFKSTDNTFAEFIAELFKDKLIEIYLGDSYEEVSTEQISTSYPAVFCGKVISAYKECLIIDSTYINNTGKLSFGNIVFINERSIRALSLIDGNGILEDMFLRSKESIKIKQALGLT
jgi:hypothetical protein